MRLFKKKVYYYTNDYSRDSHGNFIVTRRYKYPHWTTLFDQPPLEMVPPPGSYDEEYLQ